MTLCPFSSTLRESLHPCCVLMSVQLISAVGGSCSQSAHFWRASVDNDVEALSSSGLSVVKAL